ncbi:MAG: M23 family metallopeptidase [Clostridia bacterium]|nr:M23 family metallopeptidase [Clostridia bacterium]
MKTMRKIFALMLTLTLTLGMMVLPSYAATNWPATSGIQTYCLSTGNNTVVYQTTTSTAKYGTIYAADLVTIKGYDSSSDRFKVNYPISGGTKTGYVARTAITSGKVNSASGTFTATAKITTYRRASTSNTLGSISKGDKCYKTATSGNYTQVIYPISGGYKMGWIKTSAIPSSSSSSNTSTKLLYPLKGSITTSSSTKTNGYYCDYKTGGSVAVYAPADGTVVFKQAYRNSGGTKKLSSYGNYVEFTSSDGVYKIKMCHLSKFNGVSLTITQSLSYPCSGSDGVLTLKTKTVKQGDLLGYSGYSGNASGHHLHLEVTKNGKAVDPKSVFTTW